MKTKTKLLVLGLNCGSDYSITDDKGRRYTIDEARAAYEAGQVEDYNMAFKRLVNSRWDVEAVKQQFAEMDAARGR